MKRLLNTVSHDLEWHLVITGRSSLLVILPILAFFGSLAVASGFLLAESCRSVGFIGFKPALPIIFVATFYLILSSGLALGALIGIVKKIGVWRNNRSQQLLKL